MSLAGANKWTLSSRIFTSMVSLGAPGMANSTISLWCSPSAYATVSGATFIGTTCILVPSSLTDDVQIRPDCFIPAIVINDSDEPHHASERRDGCEGEQKERTELAA